ncbi:MAG: hypothetical protein PHE51_04040 [Eubacteriales bacterium]|nr:hypothetical protein [Eubacteriales bacterium]
MINIKDEQKRLLLEYIENPSDDIDTLLLELDDKITEFGFNEYYDLNEDGLKLQKLYDELYNQN